jgi:hypothetical protein
MPATLTPYALDNFVAHRLSQLTECGAREIEDPPIWLTVYVLNSAIGGMARDKMRRYKHNFLRSAEGAVSSYRAARTP